MATTTEDVWSQLTRQLFPPPGANTADSKIQRSSKRVEKNGEESSESGPTNSQEADAAGSEKDAVVPIQANESCALCVGMPGAGKSSLLNVYLNPTNDGVPKPTVALEYMFARRASAANAPKDVAHIWELGGGSHVSDLVRVPITPDRFRNALYVIVLDLSKPSSAIPHLLHWTDQIKSCVKLCVRELGKRDPRFADTLKKKTYAKLGRDHPDLRAVKPCPVPLIVVCNKYDMFKNQESARKKTLAQALRFVAHINGASLLFCSVKEKSLKDVLRTTLNTHLFRAGSLRLYETNPEKAVMVQAGSDSLDAILKTTPAGTRREDFLSGNGIADGAMDTWKRAVQDVFGAADLGDELPANAPSKDDYTGGADNKEKEEHKNPFPEPSVDEHRAQRDEILRRYRKDAERKAKLARKTTGQSPTNPGSGGTSSSSSSSSSSSRTSRAGGHPPIRRSSKSFLENEESSSRRK